MNEIKQLLTAWEEDGYVNPDSLAKACDAINLLVLKVEAMQLEIDALKSQTQTSVNPSQVFDLDEAYILLE